MRCDRPPTLDVPFEEAGRVWRRHDKALTVGVETAVGIKSAFCHQNH
jgi:hypothetical protein